LTPSLRAVRKHQDSTSLCRSKHEAPRLLEGFRPASTNIALGMWIKNKPLRYQGQSLQLQTSTPNPSPGNPIYSPELVVQHIGGQGPKGTGRAACTSCCCQCLWLQWKLQTVTRLGLICQRHIFDLEQKYWSEGGTQPYLKNRLGWFSAQPAPGDGEWRERWFTSTWEGSPPLWEGAQRSPQWRGTYREAFGTSSSWVPERDAMLLTLHPRPLPVPQRSQPCPKI